jgi:hypothetical protein
LWLRSHPILGASTINIQKKSSLIEGAQRKLRGMKETKESIRFEHTTKITNMMTMLKTK